MLFAHYGKAEITDLPIIARFEYVGRLQVPMQHLTFQKIFVACNDLLNDSYCCTFCQFLMSFDKAVKRSFGTILEEEVIVMSFFDNLVAFNDIGMVQLLVDVHFLLQKLQVFFLLTDLPEVDGFDGNLLAFIVDHAAKVNLAGVARPQEVAFGIFVLINLDVFFGIDRA